MNCTFPDHLRQTFCWISFIILCNIATTGQAQFNFLVGYNLGYFPDHAANTLFEDHNEANSYYKSSLDPIKLQHGLQLGLRYGLEYAKLGIIYQNNGLRSKAEGVPPNSTESFERQVKFRTNIFGLTAETNNDYFNYGLSIAYHLHHITGKTSELNDTYSIQKDNYWSLQFYLNFEFHGDQSVGFSIQPYYSLPLTDFSLDKLAEELTVIAGKKWKSSVIGVSFLMINGPSH